MASPLPPRTNHIIKMGFPRPQLLDSTRIAHDAGLQFTHFGPSRSPAFTGSGQRLINSTMQGNGSYHDPQTSLSDLEGLSFLHRRSNLKGWKAFQRAASHTLEGKSLSSFILCSFHRKGGPKTPFFPRTTPNWSPSAHRR